jgi:hypothetical protein
MITDYLPIVFACDDEVQKLLFIVDIVRLADTANAFESALVPPELKADFCDKISAWLRDSLKNRKFDKQRIIGDKGGVFEYYSCSSGGSTLGYNVVDFYQLGRFLPTKNAGDLINNCSKTLLGVVIELEGFISKYRGFDIR